MKRRKVESTNRGLERGFQIEKFVFENFSDLCKCCCCRRRHCAFFKLERNKNRLKETKQRGSKIALTKVKIERN